MAYTVPGVEDFVAKFPEFDEQVDAPGIEAAISLAAEDVDDSWIEADYANAILYLAAHYVSVGLAQADTVGQEAIKSLTIGPLSLTYGDQIKSSDYETSLYGQRFLVYRRRSHPAVRVV